MLTRQVKNSVGFERLNEHLAGPEPGINFQDLEEDLANDGKEESLSKAGPVRMESDQTAVVHSLQEVSSPRQPAHSRCVSKDLYVRLYICTYAHACS